MTLPALACSGRLRDSSHEHSMRGSGACGQGGSVQHLAGGLVAVGGGVAVAQGGGEPVSSPDPVVVNDSFVSPLIERFGDVRVGRGVFVASNTILRADRGRRVCLGNNTNAQDNVLVLGAGRPPRGHAGAVRRGARPGPARGRASPTRPRSINSRDRRLHLHRVPRAHPQRGHLRRRVRLARRDDHGRDDPQGPARRRRQGDHHPGPGQRAPEEGRGQRRLPARRARGQRRVRRALPGPLREGRGEGRDRHRRRAEDQLQPRQEAHDRLELPA